MTEIFKQTEWKAERYRKDITVHHDGESWEITIYLTDDGTWDVNATVYMVNGAEPLVVPAQVIDITEQASRIKPEFNTPKARRSDPSSSHKAAEEIKMKAGSSRFKLLQAHATNRDGLTDEEAATIAGLSLTSEYATRCSELERAGLLASMPEHRTGRSGQLRQVRRITVLGIKYYEEVARGGQSHWD